MLWLQGQSHLKSILPLFWVLCRHLGSEYTPVGLRIARTFQCAWVSFQKCNQIPYYSKHLIHQLWSCCSYCLYTSNNKVKNLCLPVCILFAYLKNFSSNLLHSWQICCSGPTKSWIWWLLKKIHVQYEYILNKQRGHGSTDEAELIWDPMISWGSRHKQKLWWSLDEWGLLGSAVSCSDMPLSVWLLWPCS